MRFQCHARSHVLVAGHAHCRFLVGSHQLRGQIFDLGRVTLKSPHPVREGGLSCVSCHAPHDARQTSLFGINEQCTQCHQNVRGPKVFEHPPVVEDCLICHNPHGSPNRGLLEPAQPAQCLLCHSLAINMHGGRSLNGAQMRNCVNCHSAIHGSHSDPYLKY